MAFKFIFSHTFNSCLLYKQINTLNTVFGSSDSHTDKTQRTAFLKVATRSLKTVSGSLWSPFPSNSKRNLKIRNGHIVRYKVIMLWVAFHHYMKLYCNREMYSHLVGNKVTIMLNKVAISFLFYLFYYSEAETGFWSSSRSSIIIKNKSFKALKYWSSWVHSMIFEAHSNSAWRISWGFLQEWQSE